MSEYRFTGPFYNDSEEPVYESTYEEVQSAPVNPKKEKKAVLERPF